MNRYIFSFWLYRLQFCVIFLSLFSCAEIEYPKNCDWDPGSCYGQGSLWRSELLFHPDPQSSNTSPHRLDRLPVYDGVVMTGYSDATGRYFVGLDVHTGKRLWTGSHKIGGYFSVQDYMMAQRGRYVYFYQNREWVLNAKGRYENPETFYRYDISGEKSVYRKRLPLLSDNLYKIQSLGNYMVAHENGFPHKAELRVHRLDDIGNPYAPPPPPMIDEVNQVEVLFTFTLVEDAGDVYLIYVLLEEPYTLLEGDNLADYERYQLDYKKGKSHISCYNLTQKRWVYKLKPTKGHYYATEPYGDLIVLANTNYKAEPGLWAYNWKTGEEVWGTLATDLHSVPGFPFSPSNLTHHNGVLVFSSISYAYGLDIRTGKMKWKREGFGTENSPFVFHRGVGYTATSILYGFDLETGKTLLYAECPPNDKDQGFLSKIGIHVDPETGDAIIVTRNEYYMYGYKAVR